MGFSGLFSKSSEMASLKYILTFALSISLFNAIILLTKVVLRLHIL